MELWGNGGSSQIQWIRLSRCDTAHCDRQLKQTQAIVPRYGKVCNASSDTGLPRQPHVLCSWVHAASAALETDGFAMRSACGETGWAQPCQGACGSLDANWLGENQGCRPMAGWPRHLDSTACCITPCAQFRVVPSAWAGRAGVGTQPVLQPCPMGWQAGRRAGGRTGRLARFLTVEGFVSRVYLAVRCVAGASGQMWAMTRGHHHDGARHSQQRAGVAMTRE